MQRIRWGLVGCGDVSRKRVAAALREATGSELVAACRRNGDALRSFCERFDVPRAYTSADALFADESVDAVYLATPVCEHAGQTLAAAAAGKHVLVEKPMAMSVAECDAMISACDVAGVRLGVAYYRPFYPLVDRMRALLGEGAIGRPLAVSAITATPLAMGPEDDGYWRVRLAEGGGGALMDIGSHRIDLFEDFFGSVSEVHGVFGTVAADYEAEDSAVLAMRFAGGQVGTLQCHFGSTADPDEFTIMGTAGRLVARPLNGDTLVWENRGERRTEKHPPPRNLCGPLVEDFVRAIRTGGTPRVSGARGRATNRVMQLAYSTRESA